VRYFHKGAILQLTENIPTRGGTPMADKTWQNRWTDTINYLNLKFPLSRLGDHIQSLVPDGNVRKGIAEEMSIGHNIMGENQRKALRALLLCQRVYYSDLWAKIFMGGKAETYITTNVYLKNTWKTDSLNHWRSKNEADIWDGISMFAPGTNAQRQRLAEVASFGFSPENKDIRGKLTLKRKDMDRLITYQSMICYDALLPWLTQSGITSMRWLLRNQGLTGQAACEKIFGLGEDVWNEDWQYDPNKHDLPQIPKGYLIHMWNVDQERKFSKITNKVEEDTAGYNGHWVVSNGDGTITGINNGDVDTMRETNPKIPKEFVIKQYTNKASLVNQFRAYNCPKEDGKGWHRGRMVKIDPLAIPDRL
jgi:hypothetical protein